MNLAFSSTARGAWPEPSERSKLCLHFKAGITSSTASLDSPLIAPASVRTSLSSSRVAPGSLPTTVIKMLRGKNIRRSRSRSRGAQAKPLGSPRVARGFAEGSPGISHHNPYARMESSDPLKRKQTILSLIDMLSELSGDNAVEAGSFSFSIVAVLRVDRSPQMSPRRRCKKRTCVSRGGVCSGQRA